MAPGESLAILGPSGSGKSTLLALVGGLLPVDSGEITVDGVALDPGSRAVAWIRQENALLPHRTLLDNVALPLLARGTDRVTAHVHALRELAALGLADHARTRARLVSGGEAQRAAVARAAVLAPGVVLADEPTASLDRPNALLVAECLTERFVRSIVLIATHDPRVAQRCSAVAELVDGCLIERARR